MARVESGAATRSAGIVTLSRAAIGVLSDRFGDGLGKKARVVTTCVDLERFTPSPLPALDSLRFLLVGTLNALYDVPTMVRLVERVRSRRPAELHVLSPDPSAWRPLFEQVGAAVGEAPAAAMPDRIREAHVGLSLRRPEFAMTSVAATPTKLAEFLAAGRPVVVSPGLGDMDELLARHDCGVVIDDPSGEGLAAAAGELERLVADPALPERCRALAEEHFDLEKGLDRLVDLYAAVVA